MTLRRCSTVVRDLVRLVGDMVDGHCSLLFIDMTSSDKDDLPLLFEFSNNILRREIEVSLRSCKELLSRVVYGDSRGVLLHPEPILKGHALHDLWQVMGGS